MFYDGDTISNMKPWWARTFLMGSLRREARLKNRLLLTVYGWYPGRGASYAMTVKHFHYNYTHSLGILSSSHMSILTGCLELPEVDVDEDKVDDRRAVPFSFFWLEDVAFLQALAVKDFGVNLGEWKLVHSGPLFSQKELLQCESTMKERGTIITHFLRLSITNKEHWKIWLRPWRGGWSRSVLQRSRRRWWGRRCAVAAGWGGRGGCRSVHCPLHGSSYSSHPEAHRYDQTHLGLRERH